MNVIRSVMRDREMRVHFRVRHTMSELEKTAAPKVRLVMRQPAQDHEKEEPGGSRPLRSSAIRWRKWVVVWVTLPAPAPTRPP